MDRGDWWLVVASVVLGQFALLGIEWLRGQIERRQRRDDRRDDFQRETLIELRDSISALHSNVWQMYDLVRVGKEIPTEVTADHIAIRDRIARLNPSLDDEQVRSNVQRVYDECADFVSRIYPGVVDDEHYNPVRALEIIGLYKPVGRAFDAIGERLRSR